MGQRRPPGHPGGLFRWDRQGGPAVLCRRGKSRLRTHQRVRPRKVIAAHAMFARLGQNPTVERDVQKDLMGFTQAVSVPGPSRAKNALRSHFNDHKPTRREGPTPQGCADLVKRLGGSSTRPNAYRSSTPKHCFGVPRHRRQVRWRRLWSLPPSPRFAVSSYPGWP